MIEAVGHGKPRQAEGRIAAFFRMLDGRIKRQPKVITAASFWFLLLFSYTAIMKIAEHADFTLTLSKSALLNAEIAPYIAWAVPVGEIAIGLLLFVPNTQRFALWSALGLMTIFTAYLIYMVRSGLPLTCNCGGIIEAMSWKQHIAFNIGCMLFALVALFQKQLLQLLAFLKKKVAGLFQRIKTNTQNLWRKVHLGDIDHY